jgi:hypothetical protein
VDKRDSLGTVADEVGRFVRVSVRKLRRWVG